MELKRYLIGLALVIFSSAAFSTNFYVSNNGNDNSSGTSPNNAWRTLNKVNSSMNSYNPGDSVLFESGGVFSGVISIYRSGSSSSKLVFGAYGTGARPIIMGSEEVSGWTQHNSSIWKATVNGDVQHVYVDNKPMELARFPNSGWLRNDQGSGTSIHDATLTQPNGYWNGADLVVRGSMWSYDRATISSYSNSTLNFNNIYFNLSNLDWGYFLRNKFEELDAPGEWFYNSNTNELYFWPPNGGNPNSLDVRAGVYDNGITVGYAKEYVVVRDIQFEHQNQYGVEMDGANRNEVVNCVFDHLNMGIRSYGAFNKFLSNTIRNTFATGITIIDNNSQVKFNQLENIAMQPGWGESNWGYFGIKAQGANNVISYNRLDKIGYIGIDAKGNSLIENNFVNEPLALLNDGGGIAFDDADGLIVRENIILNSLGNLESAATNHLNYHPISFGIYFGNSGISNTLIEGNTVGNCSGAGMHLDHTMTQHGNVIRDNVLYNNGQGIRFSDFSNYNGSGATSPYYVSSYDTQVSGNTICSLERDQETMIWLQVHTAQHTDFGTFDNNIYYNPFDEQSIKVIDNYQGNLEHRYTLAKWQQDYQRDYNSLSSPFWMDEYEITDYLSSELIINGTFNNGLNNWTWWPLDGSNTIDNALDGSTMKTAFNTNNTYHEIKLNHNNDVNVQSGAYYLLEFSTKGSGHGEYEPIFKLNSTSWSQQTTMRRFMPLDGNRRDQGFVFQANGGGNGKIYFNQHYTEPDLWLDNVSLHKVAVQHVDATQFLVLHYNDSQDNMTIGLNGCWEQLDGTPVSGSITLTPWSSVVLRKIEGLDCSQAGGYELNIRAYLGGAFDDASAMMRDDLRIGQLVPTNEPYSSLGFEHAGAGGNESTTNSVLSITGINAIVDWVFVELRSASNSSSVIETRSALVQRDGDIVDMDGVSPVFFNTGSSSAFVAVHHRNHLGAMTAAPITFNSGVTNVDLSNPTTQLYGQNPTDISAGNKRLLWPGNVNMDGLVKYTGTSNDRDPVLAGIGGLTPTAIVDGYMTEDVNMDGSTSYTGTDNDRDVILQSIGGAIPTAGISEQLP